tara:strand:+ start:133 stop:537 length:405 start_codon:yes stop_codon:yes gene_type:complete
MNDDYLPLSHFINSDFNKGKDGVFVSGKNNPSLNEKPSEQSIINELSKIYDPEIPVSIYDLGLIYKIDRYNNGNVKIEMSLTAPACPVAGELPKEVANKISCIKTVGEVEVLLVWDPPWTQDRMSDDAKLLLDI